MTRTDGSAVRRVASREGTEISYWTSGQGPPLLLVHGMTADHTRWRPLLPDLEPHATVYAMDRRGRGGSGDGPEYSMAREFDDVAAVVDAVAEASQCTGRRARSLLWWGFRVRRCGADLQHSKTCAIRGVALGEPRGECLSSRLR